MTKTSLNMEADARLAALSAYAILDTPPESGFDDVVFLATQLCHTPTALVSLLDRDRQWFKARIGFDCSQTPMSQSVCAHAIRSDGILIIPDLTQDPRTRDNTLVTEAPHIRFYAGCVLETPEGVPLGTLCVIDTTPRPQGLTAVQTEGLNALARQVMTQLALRRAVAQRDTALLDREAVARELRAARDSAEAANRAKSLFLTNMSHELRTPLAAVIGYSEMLEEEAQDLAIPSLVPDLQKIKANASHLLSMINNLLDLSKIEAGKMDISAEQAGVADMLAGVASTVSGLVSRKGNSLSLQLQDGLGDMQTDVTKVKQCLFNLIGNAAKFTEGGTITVSAARDETDHLIFSVADNGIGMTPDQVGQLFQRFVQADDTIAQRFGGTGLGLALTKAFCRMLGGDVTAESRLGEGTRFTMRIPAAAPSTN